MLDLLATGYPSIDIILPVSHCPAANDTGLLAALPEDITPTYGGCGANVAVAMSRLGHQVGLATLLGDDTHGRQYLAHLQNEGVDTRDLRQVSGARSSRNWLMLGPDGEYQNFYYPGAAAADWYGEVEFTTMAGARYALLTAGPQHYNRAFAQAAQQHNVPLIWQLKSSFTIYPNSQLAALWEQAFILFANAGEARWLCEQLGLTEPTQLLRGATQVVVVTHGAGGAVLHTAERTERYPSPPVAVAHTVGAGDAFTAGFLDGLLSGAAWGECARLGITLASFAISARGSQSALPKRAQFEARHHEYWSEK